ncbi:hypothetical protein DCAR_0206495 [Daucus carota subsp. sativus]|uniref:BRCT domain-containing protein n=1 Tax=Daucus carota subsp. sativus TaxID=79200 RepID=A0AAF1ANR5_DAUCS|nr:PREDICTED: BRCT domain-containing protein At4g02110-like [Daucus carota subsp. sativus]WOG87272.1 hypothetical protein DCAR_0206495 [Daucus carota subsp. sativus]
MPENSVPERSLQVFSDVRFVLLGFDLLNKTRVLSLLVSGGGVDAGQYGPDCTHVIVDNLLYDDPPCVAARNDGKALVNGLWVAHSFELGMAVGTDSVLYKPPRDQNGIPGAQYLVICLTGYQRQDRDDIMTLVSLMGANFMKPLISSTVTHLICYKFEGDKYKLAKKIKKIKIVNHLWLEDCLKAWKILPELDYDKSGYEMEVLEAVAKDSEEADVSLKNQQIPNSLRNHLDTSVSSDRSNFINANNMVSIAGRERLSGRDLDSTDVPATVGNDFGSIFGSGRSPLSDSRKSSLRLNSSEATQTLDSGKGTGFLSTGAIIKTGRRDVNDEFSFPFVPAGSQEMSRRELLDSASLISGQNNTSDKVLYDKDAHDLIPASASSPIYRTTSPRLSSRISLGAEWKSAAFETPISKATNLETSQDATLEETVQINYVHSEMGSLHGKPKNRDCLDGQEHSCDEVPNNSSSRSQMKETERCNGPSDASMSAHCKPPVNKIYNRKTWSKGSTTNLKSYLNNSLPEDNPALSYIGVEETANYKKIEILPSAANCIESRAAEVDVLQSRNEVQRKLTSVDDETEALVEKENNVVKAVGDKNETSTGESDKSEELFTNGNIGVKFRRHGTKTSGNEKDGDKQEKVACGKRKLGKSADMQILSKEIASRRKNRSSNEQKNTVIDMDPENEFTEAVFVKNNGEAEVEISGKQLGVRSKKTINKNEDASKLNKAATGGKRKLTQSVHLEKTVKEKMSKGKRCRQNKWNETTAPLETRKNNKEYEFKEICEENAGEVEPETRGDLGPEDKPEVCSSKNDSYALAVPSNTTAAGGKVNDSAEKNKIFCRKRELGEPMNMKSLNDSRSTGKKNLSHKIKKGKCISVTKLAGSPKAEDEKNEAASVNKLTKSMENDRKSVLNHVGDQSARHGINQSMKLDSYELSRNLDSTKSNSRMTVKMDSKPEPIWFITSGDKSQKKEFQQAIRKLKGNLCKDSHKWSYQATHFIVPDPLRRTEKFFAAAASGRWILKRDYISDSNKAGKFLSEEPYEWYKSCLSEDGAINLEAPRKWRLQRERTGHGAFYGLRIVIYGECIAPSLDTLKRVVKAGDGTILATSPPYTRFLESGIDFAVVSPSTPQTDMWAQEFLRHKIPCVVADYLVEFVCKPGYSLKEHVQFNTDDWAEKSLNKLVNQSETNEWQKDPANDGDSPVLPSPGATMPSNCHGDSDLLCQVCGSPGRREEMLICGHVNKSVGCGSGMHIDCCDSSLPNVPNRDWLCPKCSKSKSRKRTPKSAKKRTSVSKRK